MSNADELAAAVGEICRLVYHVTRAASLPDIVVSGALLCSDARLGCPARHSWGANDAAGRGLVCVSRIPSYEILSKQIRGEEAVIMGFESRAVCGLPGVLLCPHNSGSHLATPYLDGTIDEQSAIRDFVAEGAWRHAELLVPDSVSLGALKLIVFPDGEALARWAGVLSTQCEPALAGEVATRVDRPDGPRPHFPSWYHVVDRKPVGRGKDQRADATPVIDPGTVAPVDLDEASQELHWMDVADEDGEPDLFDELYGDGQRDHLLRLVAEEDEDRAGDAE